MHVFGVIPLLVLLAAAANGLLFATYEKEITSLLGITITAVADPVPTNQSSGSVVYGVRADVTLESAELDLPEGTGLHYDGDLAVYKLGQDTYLARFLNFSMVKHEPSTRTTCPGCSLETLIIAPPERRYPPSSAVNDAFRTQAHTSSMEKRIIAPPERRYPSRAAVNDAVRPQVGTETLISAPRRYPPHTAVNDAARSQVDAPGMETLIIAPPERGYPPNTAANDAARAQLLNYPVKFVLKSGKVVKFEIGAGAPAWVNSVYKSVLTLLQNQVETPRDLPSVSSYYEDGVSGYCRATYEVHLLNDLDVEDRAFNVTKTKHLDDCQQRQYVDDVNNTQGYTADRPKHLPNNLLPMPLSNTSESQSFTGCPESLNTVDSKAHEVSHYRVNGSSIDSALSDSLTVLPLIIGPVLVRTHLQLRLASSAAPPMGTVQFDGEPHTSLKLNLSEVAGYLNIPGYSDLLVKPAVFTQLLDEVAEELANYEFNVGTKKGPVIMLKLMRMISLLNTEQLKEAMPPSLLRETSQLEPKEQLLRALYIELLGNARSKSAVKMTLYLMKEQLLSRWEAGRLFRDMFAFFVAYSDEDTRELLQDMCAVTEGIVNPRIRDVACSSSLAWRVPKICPPGHISR